MRREPPIQTHRTHRQPSSSICRLPASYTGDIEPATVNITLANLEALSFGLVCAPAVLRRRRRRLRRGFSQHGTVLYEVDRRGESESRSWLAALHPVKRPSRDFPLTQELPASGFFTEATP
jgi:hypothetical protein